MKTSGNETLRGLATISFFFADNLQEAKNWYTEFLGIEPYYAFPNDENLAYIEFRIGDYEHELGIIDKIFQPSLASKSIEGSVAFWHVEDVNKVFDKLISSGAKKYEKIIEREGGFVTASVIDPFGNILEIMYNPHYLQILEFLNK